MQVYVVYNKKDKVPYGYLPSATDVAELENYTRTMPAFSISSNILDIDTSDASLLTKIEIIDGVASLNENVIHNNGMAEIRNVRNKLLSESDWIVTASLERGEGVPDDWKEYRQALRDITKQQLGSISWPTKPL